MCMNPWICVWRNIHRGFIGWKLIGLFTSKLEGRMNIDLSIAASQPAA